MNCLYESSAVRVIISMISQRFVFDSRFQQFSMIDLTQIIQESTFLLLETAEKTDSYGISEGQSVF